MWHKFVSRRIVYTTVEKKTAKEINQKKQQLQRNTTRQRSMCSAIRFHHFLLLEFYSKIKTEIRYFNL